MSGAAQSRSAQAAVSGREIRIRGTVQGVGLRPWIFRLACDSGIAGRVRNDLLGVTIEVFGPPAALDRFVARLRAETPPAALVTALEWRPVSTPAPDGFEIAASSEAPRRRMSIPPDIATCAECLTEVFDPANRRYRYAFTNCTNCGPRYTIVRELPYDRGSTSMAGFEMCAECRREYETVADRRFHAEPNACPVCGPRLELIEPSGERAGAGDPIAQAAAALNRGLIAAVKGLGGVHLACDATSPLALATLRERKRREAKPFAVMVKDLAAAEDLALLSGCERALLTAPERPIVLARRRVRGVLAEQVAPGNPLVGLMLPYTALHHLLLAECGRPLVMTSGNLSDEPIAYRNREALERLRGLADIFLVHDREIAVRCDDSVVRSIASRPVVVRRSRGYVPRPLPVKRPFSRVVLACGAQLKNAFCVGVDDEAHMAPHVGDLDSLEAYVSFEEHVARMERFLGVQPEVVAHDLHPDYSSTRYAMGRGGVAHIGVQHHHAHVASVMAEHGIEGQVLGVAYDGTGYGIDRAAWGGELLLASYQEFERIATFRPLALAGGDTAIRRVWRIALAALLDAFDGAPPLDRLPLFQLVPARSVEVVRRMIASRFNSPPAHGVGRYFDAIGALALAVAESRYEGQVAMMLDFAQTGDRYEHAPYSYDVDRSSPVWQIDLRPAIREIVHDLVAGGPAGAVAARFHRTLVDATAAVVRSAAELFGRLPVVLTGGCFQNERLACGVLESLAQDFNVFTNQRVPPGDGGIALGQAMVADALARRSF